MNLRAHVRGERRDEAMQLTVQAQVADHLSAIDLEGAAVVVQPHAGHARDDAVGDHRRDLARYRAVLPVLAPPRDHVHVRTLVHDLQQRGHVVGIVLQVAVEGHDVLAPRSVEPGLQRRGLAVVADQVERLEPGTALRQLRHGLRGCVARAVVHADQLEAAAAARQRFAHAVHEVREVLFLVVDRYDDRNLGVGAHRGGF